MGLLFLGGTFTQDFLFGGGRCLRVCRLDDCRYAMAIGALFCVSRSLGTGARA